MDPPARGARRLCATLRGVARPAVSALTRPGPLAGGVAAALVLALWLLSRGGLLEPPPPELVPDAFPVPEVPPSVVAAPVRVPLTRLAELLEDAVPRAYGDLSHRREVPGRDRTEVAFHLEREPFRLSVRGDAATVRTTIRYGLQAYYDPPVLPELSGSCGAGEGDLRPRLDVAIRTPVTLDREWRLRTATRALRIRPASDEDRDRCRVTLLNVDLTDRVILAAEEFLQRHVDDLDSLAAGVDVRSRVEAWWGTLHRPVQLTDSLWLVMRPEAIRRGAIVGVGDSLDVELALTARPAVHYGVRPEPDVVSLPPLEEGDAPAGLDLRLEARVEYHAASGLLQEELGGRKLDYAGRRLRLDSLRVFGVGGGRLAVALRVSGDVSARLFLVGTPVLDTSSGRISVPDLDFDVATRDVVLAAASWLRASQLRQLLRERATWAALPAAEWVTKWIVRGLNRDLSDDLAIRGDVASVRLLAAYALQEALLVRVAVLGTATLLVAPRSTP